MYQYRAQLQSTKEKIAEGHNLQDIENQIKNYKRQQKKGIHTNMNNKIEIIHMKRDKNAKTNSEELLKVV